MKESKGLDLRKSQPGEAIWVWRRSVANLADALIGIVTLGRYSGAFSIQAARVQLDHFYGYCCESECEAEE